MTTFLNSDVDTGTETIDTFADTSANAVYWDYVVQNGSNLRAGRITAVWDEDADTVNYTETSTTDIGDTSGVSFTVDITSNYVRLRCTVTSDNWSVSGLRTLIATGHGGASSLSVITTAGAANANSYCSLASSDEYIQQNIHLYATWASVSQANAEASLIYATTLLDVQMDWVGTKGTSAQSLRWPRDDIYDPDGYAVDSETIPLFLQKATAFYAYYLSQEDRAAESSTLGYSMLKAGSLQMNIDKYDRRRVLPTIIYEMVKYYGSRSSGRARVLERR